MAEAGAIIRHVDLRAEPGMALVMDAMMQRAYNSASFLRSIERFAAVQPDGVVVAEMDGLTVGAGCCVAYTSGGFGWVGLIATDPDRQRSGIGRMVTARLVDVLAGHRCAAVLDASLAGGPLYEQMEFVDHGLTKVLEWSGRAAPSGCATDPLTATDIDAVTDFDADRFGAGRGALLRTLIAQYPDRVAITVDAQGGISGYAVAQHNTIGPLVADEESDLASLVAFCLNQVWPGPPRICVPMESAHLGALLQLGFEHRRDLRHMRLGIGALPGRRSSLAGQISLGEG